MTHRFHFFISPFIQNYVSFYLFLFNFILSGLFLVFITLFLDIKSRICLRIKEDALVRTVYNFVSKTHSCLGIAQSFGVRAMKVSEP